MKTKAGSKHFQTGYVFASKHFTKCDKCCHLMDRCRVWLSSAVGRKRDHGDYSIAALSHSPEGEVTARPERCFCHSETPGTCSLGSESRSPQLGKKKKKKVKKKKLHLSRVFDYLHYQSKAGKG